MNEKSVAVLQRPMWLRFAEEGPPPTGTTIQTQDGLDLLTQDGVTPILVQGG